MAFGCVALDASHGHEPVKGVRVKPSAMTLARKMLLQELTLRSAVRSGSGTKTPGLPRSPSYLADLVLQDEVVAEGVRRQVRHATR